LSTSAHNLLSALDRAGDGVNVAGEVEVDVLGGHERRLAAASAATFDAEDRTERRLAQRDDRIVT
jgi:hypothetical protein